MKIRKNISNKLSEKDAFIKITNDILEDVLTVEEALELYPVIPESNYKEKRERYCRCIKNIRIYRRKLWKS